MNAMPQKHIKGSFFKIGKHIHLDSDRNCYKFGIETHFWSLLNNSYDNYDTMLWHFVSKWSKVNLNLPIMFWLLLNARAQGQQVDWWAEVNSCEGGILVCAWVDVYRWLSGSVLHQIQWWPHIKWLVFIDEVKFPVVTVGSFCANVAHAQFFRNLLVSVVVLRTFQR